MLDGHTRELPYGQITQTVRRVLLGEMNDAYCVKVNAPLDKVWAAITDYQSLAQVLPALVLSETIEPARGQRSYPPGMVRLRQLAVKKLAYVEFHTEVVLDVLETDGHEIQFRQFAGDFDLFQGKWILEKVPYSEDITSLRYSVEMAIETSSPNMLNLLEPLLDGIVAQVRHLQ